MPKDFVTFLDFTEPEITDLLDLADTLREAWRLKAMPQPLKSKSLALIWDAEGFRNRVAFELGIASMAGSASGFPGGSTSGSRSRMWQHICPTGLMGS